MHDPRILHVSLPTLTSGTARANTDRMVGPEFISMAAAEAENPRRLMKKAYASFVWRLMFFFIGGALCVAIVIPYNDEMLAGYINGDKEGSGTGAA